jgi:hypothetical protein
MYLTRNIETIYNLEPRVCILYSCIPVYAQKPASADLHPKSTFFEKTS